MHGKLLSINTKKFLNKKIIKTNIFLDFLKIYLVVGFVMLPILCTFFNAVLGLLLIISFYLLFGLVFYFKYSAYKDLSFFILFPLFISVFQNIILGILSPKLSETHISFLLASGSVYAFITLAVLLFKQAKIKYIVKTILIFLSLLILYGMTLSLVTKFDFAGFVSGFRNLSCCFVYLLLGYCSIRKINFTNFNKIITFIFIVTLLFGLYELLIDPFVWVKFNIGDLREKKGIPLYGSPVPVNFYSSEIVFGSQIRRMSSLFADPVNLGTFFAFTAIYYLYLNKRGFFILSVLGIVLSVSKGGLLALLILITIYFYNRKRKMLFLFLLSICFLAGVTFLIFSFNSSTQSVAAHLNGFFSSFTYILNKPLGSGIGNVGTLSAVVTGFTEETTAIFESGFGMILGQLGFFGLFLYSGYYIRVMLKIKNLKLLRQKKFAITLLLAILANIMFNEVALSPNSSAIYFITIGLLLNTIKLKETL